MTLFISRREPRRRQGKSSASPNFIYIENLLKDYGYERISLSVSKDNYAYQMYRKLGFEVMKEQNEDYLMDAVFLMWIELRALPHEPGRPLSGLWGRGRQPVL